MHSCEWIALEGIIHCSFTYAKLNNTGLTFRWVYALMADGINIFAGTNDGVFRSTDNGANWAGISAGLTNPYVYALAAIGTNLFAGTDGGVFRSTDNGTNWSEADTGLTSTTVHALMVNGTNLFAGAIGGGVFLSTDNGGVWTERNAGLTDLYVDAFAATGSNLFAGTQGANVFLSTNNGTSWSSVSTGLGDASVHTLAVRGTNLFAATEGRGVWKRPISEMTTSVIMPSIEVPSCYSLQQNYPNPFNPTTTIEYDLPKAVHVRLAVLDLLGREVATLVDGIESPGYKSVEWNASGSASGVYFYRLEATNTADRGKSFVEIRKIVLVK